MVGPTIDGYEAYLPTRLVMDLSGAVLHEIGSPLTADGDVWQQCKFLVAAVVSDCVRSMACGRVSIDEAAIDRTVDLGRLLRQQRIDLGAVVQAGVILYDTIADVLHEAPVPDPGPAGIALRTAHRSVALRVEAFHASSAAHRLAYDQEQRRADQQLLARELHDYVGANISLAQRHLELHHLYQQRGHPSAGAEVHAAERILQAVLGGTSRLIQNLRAQPPIAELAPALRAFCTSAAPEAEVRVSVAGDEGRLADAERTEIYLVCQEGLRNAFAHARASQIQVRIDITTDQAAVTIEDDGHGFDLARQPPGHHGLISMHERAELIGGRLTLTSTPGGGTRAQLHLPLHPPEPG